MYYKWFPNSNISNYFSIFSEKFQSKNSLLVNGLSHITFQFVYIDVQLTRSCTTENNVMVMYCDMLSGEQ